MCAKCHAARGLFGRKARAQRETAANTLGGGHNIGPHAIMFIGIEFAGTGHAALNFVQHQHQIMFVGQRAQPLHERIRCRPNATLALNRLDQKTCRMRSDHRFCHLEIVKFAIFESFKHRLEALVHLGLVRSADRGHCPPVKCVAEGDQFKALFIAGRLVISARALDRSLNRFRPGIGEEHGICKGVIDQHLRQLLALGAAIKVRHMHQGFGLLLDRANQALVRMPKQVDRDTAGEIEIARAILVNQVAVFAAHRADAATGVNGHERCDSHCCSSCISCRHPRTTKPKTNGDPIGAAIRISNRLSANAVAVYALARQAGASPVPILQEPD